MVTMVEDLLSFSISGIYSLLILSLTFSFLLAIRMKQLHNKLASYHEISDKKITLLKQRLELFESSKDEAPKEEKGN
ncbi:MAG: hypothetical protein V3T58_02025 [Candidatus Hydrothermarchaeales archaeon]